MKTRMLYVVAIAVVAFMVAGQFFVYGANPYHTFSDSWSVDGGIEYEVSSNTSSDYDALLIDTGISIPDGLMIYNDPGYASYRDESDMRKETGLLCSELSLRNVGYTIVDAERMRIELEEDIFNGSADMRLIIQEGALPYTVYDGGPDSLILKWLEIGGVLYWTGYTLGCAVSSVSGVYERESGYAADFLGIADQDIRKVPYTSSLYAAEKAEDYDIGKSLSVMYNDSTFGVNTQNLTDCISIGFTSSGYDSLVLAKYHAGDGMIVIFGGKPATGTIPTIAQVIASKLTYCSVIAEHDSGKLFHSSEGGIMEMDPSRNYSLYVYVGTPQIYARAFDC
ncbi:MAG: hypothetical protein PWR17_1192 [Candidatus Methanomethylophilaceae archaeon]|nr:hypothetical protein [Candidatus Methanomethylophilaceae archaeon]